MKQTMRIAIVGKGRLGRSLAEKLRGSGHTVQVLGRGESPEGAPDVVLLAVPDQAIEAASQCLTTGAAVLHCSGATGTEVLRPHRPAGSFHPLMTFPGPEVGIPDLTGVPVALDGDPLAIEMGHRLADALGMVAFRVPGDRRLYHAAAVIAGNFATVLLAEGARVLAAAGVPEDEARALLVPLATASLQNAARSGPKALTGPAVRGDEATLAAHRAALAEAGLQQLVTLYDLLSDHARSLAGRNRSSP